MKKKASPFKMLIQSHLKKSGKTQEQLATELKKSPSAMSHLLQRGTNDKEIMNIIARFLNFDVSLFNADSQIRSKGSAFQQVDKDCEEQLEYMKELLKAKDDIIRSKDETIAALRQSIRN